MALLKSGLAIFKLGYNDKYKIMAKETSASSVEVVEHFYKLKRE